MVHGWSRHVSEILHLRKSILSPSLVADHQGQEQAVEDGAVFPLSSILGLLGKNLAHSLAAVATGETILNNRDDFRLQSRDYCTIKMVSSAVH